MSFNALIFVYVSSCTFPLMFVKYNTADSQSFNRISRWDRMTVENISWSNLHERMLLIRQSQIHILLITVWNCIQLSHWGRHWSKVLSFPELKSYQWLLNLRVANYFHFQRCLQMGHDCRCDSVCICLIHQWLLQLCCILNKDNESNNDNWLKYPIILSDSSAISFLIPHFLEVTFLQSWKTSMQNGDLQFFVVN